MLFVVMLWVVMLSVVMLSVAMLSVMAPQVLHYKVGSRPHAQSLAYARKACQGQTL
jgi:hypothetical protein